MKPNGYRLIRRESVSSVLSSVSNNGPGSF